MSHYCIHDSNDPLKIGKWITKLSSSYSVFIATLKWKWKWFIFRAPIDSGYPEQSVVIERGVVTADGLAVDWVYNHIYWTDTGELMAEMGIKHNIVHNYEKESIFHFVDIFTNNNSFIILQWIVSLMWICSSNIYKIYFQVSPSKKNVPLWWDCPSHKGTFFLDTLYICE